MGIGGPNRVRAPLKPLEPSQYYRIEGLQGPSIRLPLCREKPVSRKVDVIFFSRQATGYSKQVHVHCSQCFTTSSLFALEISCCVPRLKKKTMIRRIAVREKSVSRTREKRSSSLKLPVHHITIVSRGSGLALNSASIRSRDVNPN